MVVRGNSLPNLWSFDLTGIQKLLSWRRMRYFRKLIINKLVCGWCRDLQDTSDVLVGSILPLKFIIAVLFLHFCWQFCSVICEGKSKYRGILKTLLISEVVYFHVFCYYCLAAYGLIFPVFSPVKGQTTERATNNCLHETTQYSGTRNCMLHPVTGWYLPKWTILFFFVALSLDGEMYSLWQQFHLGGAKRSFLSHGGFVCYLTSSFLPYSPCLLHRTQSLFSWASFYPFSLELDLFQLLSLYW